VLLVINKIDTADQAKLETQVDYWKEQVPNAEVWCISATEKFQISELFDRIVALLPSNPPYFPKDQLTDKPERFFVNENIREKILLNYSKEIPYAVEIETESFEETPTLIRIRSNIMVERSTQKGIIIGHKGAALKKVGMQARKDLEAFFGKQVHIELYVKVNKDWRSNIQQLKRFGYHQK
jgi:GTP-binding protein Era